MKEVREMREKLRWIREELTGEQRGKKGRDEEDDEERLENKAGEEEEKNNSWKNCLARVRTRAREGGKREGEVRREKK